MLLTKKNIKDFAKQGDTGLMEAKDIKIIAKFFNPTGAGTWYCYEYDVKEGIFYCFANLGTDMFAECGTIFLSDLTSTKCAFGLSIERDRNFTATLAEVQNFSKR